MNTLGLSVKERVLSRLLFYTLVFLGMWGLNLIVPQPGELEAKRWESLGVKRPYIAVPIEEVERALARQSR